MGLLVATILVEALLLDHMARHQEDSILEVAVGKDHLDTNLEGVGGSHCRLGGCRLGLAKG